MNLTLRADAVEPPQPVDVSIVLDGRVQNRTRVAPGEKLEMGDVDVGTHVQFEVTNSRGAGQVRANILTDNCFRATTACSEAGCTAHAEYTVVKEGCVNY